MKLLEVCVPTPVAPFYYALSEIGVVRSGFAPLQKIKLSKDDLGKQLELELRAYFAGELQVFETRVDDSKWSQFQREVYALCRQIPFGETRAYGDIAAVLGSGARAVGRAMGALPVSLIVPAHRVIRMNGALGGYQGREPIKAWLLEFEKKVCETRDLR
jgi:methylated-DNA-[protein]-cysteine S-methyltransferase